MLSSTYELRYVDVVDKFGKAKVKLLRLLMDLYLFDFENLGTEGCSKTEVFERLARTWQGIEKHISIRGNKFDMKGLGKLKTILSTGGK